MEDVATKPSTDRKWLTLGVAATLLALSAGGFASRWMRGRGSEVTEALSLRPRQVYVAVGSVTNHSATTGPAIDSAAQAAVAEALAERAEVTTTPPAGGAARGARRAAEGHVLDANVQSATAVGANTRVEVSIVVSSFPGRSYEFESTSAVTLVGASPSPDAVAMGVRRALRAATLQAVDQMNRAR